MRLLQVAFLPVAANALILRKGFNKTQSFGHVSSVSFEKGLLFFSQPSKSSNSNQYSKRYQEVDQLESSSLDNCDSNDQNDKDKEIIDELVENANFFKFQLWMCFQHTQDKTCHVRLKYIFDPVLERFERFSVEFRKKTGLIKVMRSFSIVLNRLERNRKRQCLSKFGSRSFCTEEEMLGSVSSGTKV